jgi:hypothetical protein
MVENAHETIRPTGIARTYYCMETNQLEEQNINPLVESKPNHVTVLPFYD